MALRERKTVVIVDDSAALRGWLRCVLNEDPRLHVIGEAGDAEEARAVIKQTDPDVITLDIEMPRMSGLVFLEHLMRLRPMPVVMLSTQTARGSHGALQALSLGALDCIWKPSDPRGIDMQAICDSVYTAATAHVENAVSYVTARKDPYTPKGDQSYADDMLMLIGASTGGVAAIETILSHMPIQAPPIVIAQHMPEHFLQNFAARLNDQFPQCVALAENGERLENGMVRLATADDTFQTGVSAAQGAWHTEYRAPEGYEKYTPSVDHLFYSAVHGAPRTTSLILTGLGRDGTDALCALSAGGGYTIGQSQRTCVVYGMPRAASEAGALSDQVDLDQMAAVALSKMGKRDGRRAG